MANIGVIGAPISHKVEQIIRIKRAEMMREREKKKNTLHYKKPIPQPSPSEKWVGFKNGKDLFRTKGSTYEWLYNQGMLAQSA